MAIKSIAVIGLRHGARHVEGFLRAGISEIHAIDLNEALSEQFKDNRVHFSMQYAEVIKKVDAIVISLPPALHKKVLTDAISTHAKRIWIEKPLLDISEDASALSDTRVEVIYELRRSLLLQDELDSRSLPKEVWLTWKRPVPNTLHTRKIEVVHDLGTHLIDFAKILAEGRVPEVTNVSLTYSRTNAQEVSFDLYFPKMIAHICAAWATPEEWPDDEIIIEQQFEGNSTSVQWVGKKSSHRHLTNTGMVSQGQINQEKDWYKPALEERPTHFSSLEDAIITHQICNNVLALLEKEGLI